MCIKRKLYAYFCKHLYNKRFSLLELVHWHESNIHCTFSTNLRVTWPNLKKDWQQKHFLLMSWCYEIVPFSSINNKGFIYLCNHYWNSKHLEQGFSTCVPRHTNVPRNFFSVPPNLQIFSKVRNNVTTVFLSFWYFLHKGVPSYFFTKLVCRKLTKVETHFSRAWYPFNHSL